MVSERTIKIMMIFSVYKNCFMGMHDQQNRSNIFYIDYSFEYYFSCLISKIIAHSSQGLCMQSLQQKYKVSFCIKTCWIVGY